MEIIVDQILILSVLVVVGVIAAKLSIITTAIKDGIAKIVFDITLPLLIFTTFAKLEFTQEILIDSSFAFVFSFVSVFLLLLIGKFSSTLLKLDERKKTIHILHTMFGNIVFLGFPLFNALFPGGKGLLYAAIYQLAQDTVLWTLGIYMLNKNCQSSLKERLSRLVNPNTIAFILGITFMLLKIKLPFILQQSLGGLGHTTIYLSMIYIGVMLSFINIKTILKKQVFILSFNKMILTPIILLFIINQLINLLSFEIGMIAKTVVIMQAAMPCMATIVVLAKKYDADDTLATENIFISTIISLLTLPAIYYIIQLFS